MPLKVKAMYFCTDCQLPATLDDAVAILADDSCICVACYARGAPGLDPGWDACERPKPTLVRLGRGERRPAADPAVSRELNAA